MHYFKALNKHVSTEFILLDNKISGAILVIIIILCNRPMLNAPICKKHVRLRERSMFPLADGGIIVYHLTVALELLQAQAEVLRTYRIHIKKLFWSPLYSLLF